MSKKKRSRIKLHRILFIVFLSYLIFSFLGQIGLKKDLQAKKRAYEREIADLEDDVKSLKEEIKNSDSLEFIEKIAREELGMVKPREIIVIDENK